MSTPIGMMDPAYVVSETSCRAPDVLFSVLSCPVVSSPFQSCPVLSCPVLCCACRKGEAMRTK